MFEAYESWILMACPEYEDRLLALQDNQLSAPDRPAVEAHLAACMACRHFADDLKQLDAVLAASIRHPALAPDFKTKMLRRVDAEFAENSTAIIAQRKQAEEMEFQKRQAALRKRALRLDKTMVLDLLAFFGVAVVATLFGDVVWQQVLALSLKLPGLAAGNSSLLVAWASGAVCLVVGLSFGLRRAAIGGVKWF